MYRISILLSLTLLTILTATPVYAGNAATIVLETGVVFKIRQGYDQLSREFNQYNKEDYANKFVELKIDGTSVAINLGRIAAICRDDCSIMEIKVPKK